MFDDKKTLEYYNAQLHYLHTQGKEFAHKYPEIANSLQIDIKEYSDPHLKKLTESFAFLTSRLHLKMDQQFYKIPRFFLQQLYPYITYNTPSYSIMNFIIKHPKVHGTIIPAQTNLSTNMQEKYTIQTCTDIKLTTSSILESAIELGSTYNLQYNRLIKIKLQKNADNQITFFCNASYQESMLLFHMLETAKTPIYIIKNNDILATQLKLTNKPHILQKASLCDNRFQILQEYMLYYKQFMFFTLDNLESITDDTIEILIPIANKIHDHIIIDKNTFLLNCVPAINIFTKSATPINLTHLQQKYPITASSNEYGIHSIEKITGYYPNTQKKIIYNSFLQRKYSEHSYLTECEENQWNVSIYKSNIDIDQKEVLLVEANYYNKNINNLNSNTLWCLDTPITGIECHNLERFSKPLPSLKDDALLMLLQNMHTQYLANLHYTNPNIILNNLLLLFSSFNNLHVNLNSYITNIQSQNTVIYKRIGMYMCAIPSLNLTLQINNHNAHAAFLFATVLSNTFEKLAPLNTCVVCDIIELPD